MHQGRKDIAPDKAFPLTMASPGTYEVADLRGGREFTGKLLSMGVQAGKRLELITTGGCGPLMVNVEGSRIALGRGIAHRILVRNELSRRNSA